MRVPCILILVQAIAFAGLAFSGVLPAVNESLVKPRAFGVRVPSADYKPDQLPQPWPNNRFLYRFEDQESAGALNDIFEDAWQIWIDHGLRLTKHQDPDKSVGIVVIKKIETGSTATVVGYQPGRTISMTINVKAELGHPDLRVVVAHELGHALGLYHEHQKPIASNKIKLKLKNLADWDDSVRKAGELDPPRSPDDLATNFRTMNEVGANCADVVPYDTETAQLFYQDNANDIDWDSIMLYGSDFGGKPTGHGKKKAVMKKRGLLRNWTTFKAATVPSERDIAYVHTLHGIE